MIRKILEDLEIGTIKLVGSNATDIQMWSINYYIQEFCNNYNKISTIKKICMLMQEGAYDSQFIVANKSAELFASELIRSININDEKSYTVLANKKDDPNKFWESIVRKSRPIVFYKNEGEIFPLVGLKNKDSIKITSLKYNSPPIIDAQGAIGGLIDLAYAGTRNERDEERFIANQIGVSADNYKRIALASQVVDNSRTPSGVRAYANQGLQTLLDRQAVLNKKLGIRIDRIDRRI